MCVKTTEQSRAEEILRLCSGVMLGFGILRIVLSALLLAGILGLDYMTGGIFRTAAQLLAAGFLICSGVVELVCAILGRRCVKRRRGATACLILGALCLALDITAVILTLRLFPKRIILGLGLNVLLPGVYLGAALGCSRLGAEPSREEPQPAPETEDAPEESF